MLFSAFIFIPLGIVLASKPPSYPIKVGGFGDFVVQAPLISEAPDEAVMHPVLPKIVTVPPPNIISHPLYTISSFETISALQKNDFDFDSPISGFTKHLINRAADEIDVFNPSILGGNRSARRVAIFATYFFRLFKLTYPGLGSVKISPLDLFHLITISYAVSMSHEEASERKTDSFLFSLLSTFFKRHNEENSHQLTLNTLLNNGCKFSFLAAKNMMKNNTSPRAVILENLKFETIIGRYLYERDKFLEYLPYVQNINDVVHCDLYRHVLLSMIANGEFYEESMLRPELKEYRNPFDDDKYKGFYSMALLVAIENRNVTAIIFLLKLDDGYYGGPPTPNSLSSYSIPFPIPTNELNGLRALFLSENLDQIYLALPNISEFRFNFRTALSIASEYKSNFPALKQLHDRLRRPTSDDFKRKRPRKNNFK